MIFRVALFVPLFVVVKTFGLTGLWAAGAPLLAWPVGTFLSRISAEAIPRSFLDEAQMDGASAWQLFRLVVAPMLKPVATFLLVTRAVDVLGDYGWQMVNLRSVAYKTLLVWLVEAKYMRMSDAMFLFNYGADAAAGILLLLPIVVVFYLGRKAMLGIDPIGKGLME
jgi:ABC-type glycerol-3-phosphate transport system permease component